MHNETNTEPSAPVPTFQVTRSRARRLWHWLRTSRSRAYFFSALGITLITGVGLISWMVLYPQVETPMSTIIRKPEPKEPPKYYSPLTGVEVADEALTKRPITAIMLENSPDARPQSGLKDAGIVYEAVAEGGITRFNALYQETRPGLIGPVRSLRPYYTEWGAAYDAAVAHIGGSKRALEMVRGGGYGVDIDQFFNPGAYWRSTDRYAPHNVYTNFDRLDALNAEKGKTSSNFTPWPRIDIPAKTKKKTAQPAEPAPTPNATTIDIDVSSGAYHVNYDYDAASQTYLRKQGGEPHMDREAGRIQPRVVIAIKVPMSLGFEDGYREQITTIGSGEAYVFQNGIAIQGTWSKENPTAPIVLKDIEGKEIKLARGQTWVTALANTRGVTWQ